MIEHHYANRNLNILTESPNQFSDIETSEQTLSSDEGKGGTVVY